MQRYKWRLGWSDGLGAIIFHGQRANVADIFNLTNIFQVAAIYEETRFAELKLVLGYIFGVILGRIAGYSEGHYLLTEKGGRQQLLELKKRNLTQRDVWVLDPSDPRRATC